MDAGEWIWLDGAFVPAQAASCSVLDRGIVVGDGCFETIPVIQGAPFAPTRHLARFRRSLAGLGFEVPSSDAELREAFDEIVVRNGVAGQRIRLTATAGTGSVATDRRTTDPMVVVATTARIERPASTAVVTVPWRRNERGALVGIKSTSYAENVIALAEARRQGASEALMANTRDELAEGTGSNVFVVVGGRLVTPPLSSGCLDGITRALVMESVPVEERPLPLAELGSVEAAFLTSSTRDVQPIDRFDGRTIPPDHDLVTAAVSALAAVMERTLDP